MKCGLFFISTRNYHTSHIHPFASRQKVFNRCSLFHRPIVWVVNTKPDTMGKSRANLILRGTSGRLGNLVSTIDGILRRRPDPAKKRWSPLQREHLARFQEAKAYARMAISDPELNDFYARRAARKKGLGAWHLAISDFLSMPRITEADLTGFHGRRGSRVSFRWFVRCGYIVSADVSIFGSDGRCIEEGKAVEEPVQMRWAYTLADDLPAAESVVLVLRVRDLPGHAGMQKLEWPATGSRVVDFEADAPARRVRKKSQLRPRAPF